MVHCWLVGGCCRLLVGSWWSIVCRERESGSVDSGHRATAGQRQGNTPGGQHAGVAFGLRHWAGPGHKPSTKLDNDESLKAREYRPLLLTLYSFSIFMFFLFFFLSLEIPVFFLFCFSDSTNFVFFFFFLIFSNPLLYSRDWSPFFSLSKG